MALPIASLKEGSEEARQKRAVRRHLNKKKERKEIDESADKGLAAAHAKAKEESKKGYVQHVEKDPTTGRHRISDWYDSNHTVASYENGRKLDEGSEESRVARQKRLAQKNKDKKKEPIDESVVPGSIQHMEHAVHQYHNHGMEHPDYQMHRVGSIHDKQWGDLGHTRKYLVIHRKPINLNTEHMYSSNHAVHSFEVNHHGDETEVKHLAVHSI